LNIIIFLTGWSNRSLYCIHYTMHFYILVGLWCLTPQYLIYIMGVSFIGGGNRSTCRKR